MASGTYFTSSSNISLIPSPLTEEQQNTGAMSPVEIPFTSPLLNCSSVNSPASKYISISSSSTSAMASLRASLSSRVATEVPNLACNSPMVLSISTFSLSVLVIMKNLGISAFLQAFHAFSVPTCIPDDASTRIAAASTALRADWTSPTKSKNPGASTKLIFTLLYSTGTMVVLIEYPFSISILS